MNNTRFYEIQNNKSLTAQQKDILFKIEDRKDAIDFWQVKINEAKYHIEQNEKKIQELKKKLEAVQHWRNDNE